MNRPAIRVVLAVLLVCFVVIGYVIYRHQVAVYRHQVANLQADLRKLEAARQAIAAHDATLDRTSAHFGRLEADGSTASQRRHDSAISANFRHTV